MRNGLYFRGNPVEVRISYPDLGFISISLVSFDDSENIFLELTVQDDFSHALDIVKELLSFYES